MLEKYLVIYYNSQCIFQVYLIIFHYHLVYYCQRNVLVIPESFEAAECGMVVLGRTDVI